MISVIVAIAEGLIDRYGYDQAVSILTAAAGVSKNLVRAVLRSAGL